MSAVRRRLSVLFTPAEVDPVISADRVAVVVDVLRSTSVLPVALAGGALEMHPTSSVAEARALRGRMPGALLGGEAAGEKPAGFDFGNSPLEYTPERVAGRSIVYTSTNGMPALLGLRASRRAMTAAFVNEGAVCNALLAMTEDVLLVAAGKDRRPALEDVACCGSIVDGLQARDDGFALDDGAQMALAVWRDWAQDTHAMLRASAHGAWLAANGWAEDLEFCARRDTFTVVPVLQGRRLVALS